MLSYFNHVQLFATLWTVAHQTLCPWNSPGENTGVGCHTLLQGIIPTQGWNPNLLFPPTLAGGFLTNSSATWEALLQQVVTE